MAHVFVRSMEPDDAGWVRRQMSDWWGGETIVVHGVVYRPHELAGLVAERDGDRIGLLTYSVRERECEIVTLNSVEARTGVGTALIGAVQEVTSMAGCSRLWLVTTNDNLEALRFYQKQGFVLAALHRDAVATARRLKPQIPLIGHDGIAIRDEIELEMLLR